MHQALSLDAEAEKCLLPSGGAQSWKEQRRSNLHAAQDTLVHGYECTDPGQAQGKSYHRVAARMLTRPTSCIPAPAPCLSHRTPHQHDMRILSRRPLSLSPDKTRGYQESRYHDVPLTGIRDEW